jgi:UDP-3-O-[3-hydroxymyristoyl] glucosamine N-acyltransferase
MKFEQIKSIIDITDIIGGQVFGNKNIAISGINEIHKVEGGDIVFVDHPKYYKKALNSLADVILIDKKIDDIPEGKAIIICESPFDAFNKITSTFRIQKEWTNSNNIIHDSAVIYPNVSIGNNVKIGKNSIIHAGAVISDFTYIGDNVIIGPNSVLGHSAFYYKKKPSGYDRLISCGRTIIEDNVEIGALVTIDRGVSGDTIIGKGTKIDNQVQVGHDTVIGENCLFAANVGVAGCVTIKNNVTLWGQVGVTSDVTIEDNVTVHAQSGVGKNLDANKVYFGSPCGDARTVMKEMAAVRKLPSIIENL